MSVFTWLEHTRLATWVGLSDSFFAYPSILLLHTIGLTLVVGVQLVVALRVIGLSPHIPLRELDGLLRLAWVGLALNVPTGVLLLIAKATQFVVNPAFYLKMLSVGLAVSIFFVMKARLDRRNEADESPCDRSSRLLAVACLSCWLLAIVAGRAMAYVGEAAEFGGV